MHWQGKSKRAAATVRDRWRSNVRSRREPGATTKASKQQYRYRRARPLRVHAQPPGSGEGKHLGERSLETSNQMASTNFLGVPACENSRARSKEDSSTQIGHVLLRKGLTTLSGDRLSPWAEAFSRTSVVRSMAQRKKSPRGFLTKKSGTPP